MAPPAPAAWPPGDPGDLPDAATGVTGAAADLYARDPGDFTRRRKELATAARARGDRAAAREIAALRKPTRAAWVVNLLVRAVPDAPGRLADVASALRDAERSGNGSALREESARRSALIGSLTDQAFAVAGIPDPPPALGEEVTATLAAVLADPEVAAQFTAGTLTRAARWSGFGLASQLPPGTADAGTAGDASPSGAPAGASPASAAPVPLPPPAPSRLPPQASRRPSPKAAVPAPRAAPVPPAGDKRPAAGPRHSLAEEAERTVATAEAVTAEAVAAEERFEDRVRDLEQQLTEARANLADARLRARRAESSERKARQALARRQSNPGP